jgi:hypothetical protein
MVTTTTTTICYDAADNRGEGQGKERRNVYATPVFSSVLTVWYALAKDIPWRVFSLVLTVWYALAKVIPWRVFSVYKAPSMEMRKLVEYNIEVTELQYADLGNGPP